MCMYAGEYFDIKCKFIYLWMCLKNALKFAKIGEPVRTAANANRIDILIRAWSERSPFDFPD